MRRTWLLCFTLAMAACGGSVSTDGSGGSKASGGSGGNSGGTGGSTGGTGGSTGGTGGSSECQDLQTQFGAALEQAKNCNPFMNSLQCTLSFHSAVACGCPTFVNPANTSALDQLKTIEQKWIEAGCKIPCPFSCPAAPSAGCAPNGQGDDAASCKDFFGT